MSTTSLPTAGDFAAHLERARASGTVLLDLTESDPSRCGLTWDAAELGTIVGRDEPPTRGAREARDAVSSYLAGRGASVSPDRVLVTRSIEESYRLLLRLLCGADDEVLVASPSHPFVERLAASESVRVGRYALAYDGAWRLDRKSLARAIGRRTRAIMVGNPSIPTGAILARDDLAFLESLCGARRLALVGDEAFADTALTPAASVAEARQCLAFHVSGLSGVCGISRVAEWLAVTGPEDLVAPALSRLAELAGANDPVPGAVQLGVPALLARREEFLGRLRARLAENRASLATAALREAPWSLQWGRGGCWAILQISAAEEEESLCLALLEDGLAVLPGFFQGLPRDGFLVVSLLPEPEILREALSRLDQRLRAPLVG